MEKNVFDPNHVVLEFPKIDFEKNISREVERILEVDTSIELIL